MRVIIIPVICLTWLSAISWFLSLSLLLEALFFLLYALMNRTNSNGLNARKLQTENDRKNQRGIWNVTMTYRNREQDHTACTVSSNRSDESANVYMYVIVKMSKWTADDQKQEKHDSRESVSVCPTHSVYSVVSHNPVQSCWDNTVCGAVGRPWQRIPKPFVIQHQHNISFQFKTCFTSSFSVISPTP